MSSLTLHILSDTQSEVTLIDENAYESSQIVLSLTRDDMHNTELLSVDGRVLYKVETDAATCSRTAIYREGMHDVVAVIKRMNFGPDKIKFGVKKSIKLSSWLHGAHDKWSDFPVSFEWGGRTYTWKTNSARQIALYEHDDDEDPVARFQTSRTQIIDGVLTRFRALLALRPDAFTLLDPIVITLLIVESELRNREMRYRNSTGLASRYA